MLKITWTVSSKSNMKPLTGRCHVKCYISHIDLLILTCFCKSIIFVVNILIMTCQIIKFEHLHVHLLIQIGCTTVFLLSPAVDMNQSAAVCEERKHRSCSHTRLIQTHFLRASTRAQTRAHTHTQASIVILTSRMWFRS